MYKQILVLSSSSRLNGILNKLPLGAFTVVNVENIHQLNDLIRKGQTEAQHADISTAVLAIVDHTVRWGTVAGDDKLGVDLISDLKAAYPNIKTILISNSNDRHSANMRVKEKFDDALLYKAVRNMVGL
jgi:3-deoxy-D-manno-octulosonic-acid transferase